MGLNYVDDLIDDDEVPELTEEDFASMIPFAGLPEEEQRLLLSMKDATICPDAPKKIVDIALSADVLGKFEAMGAGWESKVDGALREWLEEHKAS